MHTIDQRPAYGDGWGGAVRLWEETTGPGGSRVEIVEGIVTVALPPTNRHQALTELVQRRLSSVLPEAWGIYQAQGVAVPSCAGLYLPDLAVVPRTALREPGNHIPAAACELVVEITSPSNARHDRVSKPAGYARAQVPLYLLVDPHAPGGPTVTLYGEPKEDVYRVLAATPFGGKVSLPQPFGLTLDTADFPTD